MALSEDQLRDIAHRWANVINTANVDELDDLVAYDVVDHSGLAEAHGSGCDGYKRLVARLRDTFPDYSSQVDGITIDGDVVTIKHTGTASYPQEMNRLLGSAVGAPAQKMSFQVTSAIRVNEQGQIVEHWAVDGPFGTKGRPGDSGESTDVRTGTPELNKVFMQQYVKNVIDAMNPQNARFYMTENFFNHDPAPGERPGLDGAVEFIGSIFSAFSGFQTKIEEQIAEDDLVVGRWSQQFTNTGPYLNFPASGRDIHIGGITITRVRDNRILEEWEARSALSLLNQMGVPAPLGALEDGPETGSDEANKEIARRFFYDIWHGGNVGAAEELFAPDFVEHSPVPGQRSGVDGVVQLVRAFRTGFPDSSISVDLQVATGDRVASRYTMRGTHLGTFRGVPPTGRPVELTGISIHAVEGGKLTEHWGFFDEASLVLQLGLIQLPGGTPGGGTPGGGTPGGGTPGGGTPGGETPGGGTPNPTPNPTPTPGPSPWDTGGSPPSW